ncbi:MAG TPA: hypothetical protein VEJ87_01590 [Acidimicrobiales bacterium]|nr:hypothetical protein [Acidimicrobiales bacterium]
MRGGCNGLVSRLVVVCASSVLICASTAFLSAGAWADVSVGKAEITQPGSDAPLNSGGSATQYGVLLPAGAACSGDTQHKQYHIDSYLFPKNVLPTSVSFKTGQPAQLGSDGQFGFISDGQYVGALNTAPFTGAVVGLPQSYTWTRLTPKDLFTEGKNTSTWNAGIACATPGGVVTNYWNTEIVFKASSSDPGGFTWSVTKADATSPGFSLPVGVWLLIAAAVLALVAIILSRRQGKKNTGQHNGHHDAPLQRSEVG